MRLTRTRPTQATRGRRRRRGRRRVHCRGEVQGRSGSDDGHGTDLETRSHNQRAAHHPHTASRVGIVFGALDDRWAVSEGVCHEEHTSLGPAFLKEGGSEVPFPKAI